MKPKFRYEPRLEAELQELHRGLYLASKHGVFRYMAQQPLHPLHSYKSYKEYYA